MKTNYPEIIRSYYPKAITHTRLVEQVKLFIRTEFNINPEQVMAANSICSDDINAMQFPNLGEDLLGPFNLGGLGGEPFTGLTGLKAFAHHQPAKGALLIFYGPHIGITIKNEPKGKPGYVFRKGQLKESECCGALIEGIRRIEKPSPPPPPAPPDYQEDVLTQVLYKQRDFILNSANNRYMAATQVAYQSIHKNIYALIQQAIREKFIEPELDVLMVGGTIINVDETTKSEAYFSMEKFGRVAAHTRLDTDHLESFMHFLQR